MATHSFSSYAERELDYLKWYEAGKEIERREATERLVQQRHAREAQRARELRRIQTRVRTVAQR